MESQEEQRVYELEKIVSSRIYFSNKELTLYNRETPKVYSYPYHKRKQAKKELKKIREETTNESLKKLVSKKLKDAELDSDLEYMLGKPIGLVTWISVLGLSGLFLFKTLYNLYFIYQMR